MTNNGFEWSSLADLSGLAGVTALIWQIVTAIKARGKRPKLHVKMFDPKRDLGIWKVDDGPVVQKVLTLEVVNTGAQLASRCVAKATILNPREGTPLRNVSVPLHWAGTEYTSLDTGAHPVDIGSEERRLDVAFTRNIEGQQGCWLAAPLALSRLDGAPQFFLPPGSYDLEVVVSCPGGESHRVALRIESPLVWDQLTALPQS